MQLSEHTACTVSHDTPGVYLALVWFLEQLGSCQSTLGAQGVMVLLRKAVHLLEGAYGKKIIYMYFRYQNEIILTDNESDGRELSLGVGDFILVQGKGLKS